MWIQPRQVRFSPLGPPSRREESLNMLLTDLTTGPSVEAVASTMGQITLGDTKSRTETQVKSENPVAEEMQGGSGVSSSRGSAVGSSRVQENQESSSSQRITLIPRFV